MSRKFTRFIPVILWMALIFFFSSRPDLPSNKIYVVDFIMKKTAHFFEYTILFLLWFRALGRKNPAYAFMAAIAYAFTDETHQLFVPGRTGLLRDVAIDSTGMLISWFLIVKFALWKQLLSLLPTKKHAR
jgi:VanZ family protein